ncbi:MAG TPA: hypothetical protein VFB33_06900 [Candidatus Binataceae bacterium]|jgi:hypothetical protein|nr:hypothetical protein [Candidatus Binataceae bacterium]
MNPLHDVNILFSSLIFGNAVAMYLAALAIADRLHKRAYSRRLANLPPSALQQERSKGAGASLKPQTTIFRSRSKVLSARLSLESAFSSPRSAAVTQLARSQSFASRPRLFNEAA